MLVEPLVHKMFPRYSLRPQQYLSVMIDGQHIVRRAIRLNNPSIPASEASRIIQIRLF